MPCYYVLLADENFNILEFYGFDDKSRSNVTVEWVVKEKNCPISTYLKADACGDNINCDYSENGKGYRCLCKVAFRGNTYLGCHRMFLLFFLINFPFLLV